MGNSGPLYYGDENLVSVIDQVVQFTALFSMWFTHFWYHRWIRALVFEWQEGRHFIDSISSWDLVIHDQLSLVCLNEVSLPVCMDLLLVNGIIALLSVHPLRFGAFYGEFMEGQSVGLWHHWCLLYDYVPVHCGEHRHWVLFHGQGV